MQQGTKKQALDLIRQRWSTKFSFDLDFDALMEERRPQDMVQAANVVLRICQTSEPEIVHKFFVAILESIEKQRATKIAARNEFSQIFHD